VTAREMLRAVAAHFDGLAYSDEVDRRRYDRTAAALRALADRMDREVRENEDGDPANRCHCMAEMLARLDAPLPETPGEPPATRANECFCADGPMDWPGHEGVCADCKRPYPNLDAAPPATPPSLPREPEVKAPPCKPWCGTTSSERRLSWRRSADLTDYCSIACAEAGRPLSPRTEKP